jgi:uncharacterized protein YmfQ (DUF2313 family)
MFHSKILYLILHRFPNKEGDIIHKWGRGFYVKKNKQQQQKTTHKKLNRIGGVMVGVITSSAVDRGFEPRSGQTKDYKIGIFCLFAKRTASRRKNKDWLTRKQNNVSEWSDLSARGLLFQ